MDWAEFSSFRAEPDLSKILLKKTFLFLGQSVVVLKLKKVLKFIGLNKCSGFCICMEKGSENEKRSEQQQ